jgi:hypothetical protein
MTVMDKHKEILVELLLWYLKQSGYPVSCDNIKKLTPRGKRLILAYIDDYGKHDPNYGIWKRKRW